MGALKLADTVDRAREMRWEHYASLGAAPLHWEQLTDAQKLPWLLKAATEGGMSDCGHPNHGGTDHDCRPFVRQRAILDEKAAEHVPSADCWCRPAVEYIPAAGHDLDCEKSLHGWSICECHERRGE